MLGDFTALGGVDFEENVDTTNIKKLFSRILMM